MNIIGGAKPTGKLPGIVGSGIFGYKKLNDGIFAGGTFQPSYTPDGIFFEPYSFTSYEKAEPSTGWALERWPGVPLYPGSWAHGLNLVGPSMGAEPGGGGGIPWGWAAVGIAGGFLAAFFLARRGG